MEENKSGIGHRPCCFGEFEACRREGGDCADKNDCQEVFNQILERRGISPARRRMAREEVTCNPIFVFIAVTYICPGNCPGLPEDFEEHCEKEETCEYRVRQDHVHRVFATREEGEAWGRSQQHNYGQNLCCDEAPDGKVKGWIVYCVPCMGSLVDILGRTE